MNYYYDIILNWNEGDAYEFFEWNDNDALELIKKIPLVKVKHKVLLDLMTNIVKVEKSFLEAIEDKTLISDKKNFKKIEYACLFTDAKNAIALEFNEEGLTISRSNLLVDDELNVEEVIYGIKETIISYEIKEKLEKNKSLRQEREAKKLILLEIKKLYNELDYNKLKYLYYEYKKEKVDDIDYIYEQIINDLQDKMTKDILKLYHIIKLSYHKV